MPVAVVVFPGTNCEHDVVHALGVIGVEAELIFHKETALDGFDGAVLPGGFAHGDYLRTGAIARFSPIMPAVGRMAAAGAPVLGICNGFQILCESGMLPGALVANRDLRFVCRDVDLIVTSTDSVLTRSAEPGQVLRIPLNSYEGNFTADPAVLDDLDTTVGIVLRYCNPDGSVDEVANPNGAARNAAAIVGGPHRNVAGIMPHPERAVEEILGSTDGRVLLESFAASLESGHV